MCVFHLNLRTTIKRQWQTYLLQNSLILFWTWKLWRLCKYFDGFPSSAWTAALLYGRKTHSDVFDSQRQKRINNNLISISTLHCRIINLNAFRLKKKTLHEFYFQDFFFHLKKTSWWFQDYLIGCVKKTENLIHNKLSCQQTQNAFIYCQDHKKTNI